MNNGSQLQCRSVERYFINSQDFVNPIFKLSYCMRLLQVPVPCEIDKYKFPCKNYGHNREKPQMKELGLEPRTYCLKGSCSAN